ncbi:MAG TPA: hypothetical protein VKC60_15845 [Opitutaceae bacterium]|nr:hypothetical protein [Opitutaceae bacterium]
MKTKLVFTCLAALAVSAVYGDGDPKAKRDQQNPTSKLFVASVKGENTLNNGEKLDDLSKANAFPPDNSIIETKPQSSNSMVYSNGTGIYVDQETRLEVKSFEQEPFNTTRNDVEDEPSISQTQAHVAHGFVGICTPKLAAGSNMVYSTPLGSVQIHGKQVAIEAKDNETTIYMLEGDSTVRAGLRDLGGQTLHPGQKAVIRPGAAGQPNTISIADLTKEDKDFVSDKVGNACKAKKTVVWDVVEKKPKIISGAANTTDGADSANSAAGNNTTSTTTGGTEAVPTAVTTISAPNSPPVSADRVSS